MPGGKNRFFANNLLGCDVVLPRCCAWKPVRQNLSTKNMPPIKRTRLSSHRRCIAIFKQPRCHKLIRFVVRKTRQVVAAGAFRERRGHFFRAAASPVCWVCWSKIQRANTFNSLCVTGPLSSSFSSASESALPAAALPPVCPVNFNGLPLPADNERR